jgi:cytosine/adenosine deaminase-related metal-dependent hydrolase
MRVYAATRVFPVARPPIHEGAVAVDGETIVSVGPRAAVLAEAGNGAELCDLGQAALLPGLINAHCHVELSWMGQDPPPGGDYMAWLRGLLERRAAEDPQVARPAAERAIDTMVDRGTVALGDVSNGTWAAPMLARSELQGVAFHEIYGIHAGDAERRIGEAIERREMLAADPDVLAAGDRWRVVLTPHAPHTTSEPLLRALAGRAAAAREPLSVHVAESEAEVAFLRDGSGPFPEFHRERGPGDPKWQPSGLTPVEHLDRAGALTSNSLAVHCVHLVHRDHTKLQSRGVSVVTCPRSNERLCVGKAPIPELLAEGIPVALGTDSLASAPDLDLLAEMAALRRLHPRLTPPAVLRMATLNGAAALGLADRLGSIEPGKLARLIVIPLDPDDDDPLGSVCNEPGEVYPLERAPYGAATP